MILNLTIGQQQVTANIVINPSYISNGGGGTWGSITGTLANQTDLNTALNNRVDKVTGKGLSTEDYTTTEKNKLASLSVVPDVTVNPLPFSITVDLSEPNQLTQYQLTGATEFTPGILSGIIGHKYEHIYILDLNSITPTFAALFKNFLADNTEAVPNLTAGYLNVLWFTKIGTKYYYAWIDSYEGTIADVISPTLSNFTISDSYPSRVYFNSSEVIIASTFTGFAISGKTISGITINTGQTTGHYFTVTAAFIQGGSHTIAYTTGSNLQDANANALEAFSATAITNNIANPTLTSATVENATDNRLSMTFIEAVTITTAGWSISASGGAVTINSVSGSGTSTPYFVLSRSIAEGETVTVSYSGGVTTDLGGNPLATITNLSVTNNVTDLIVLNTPANFVATVFSSTRIDLTWDDIANESSYQIDRSTNQIDWTQIGGTIAAGSTSYSATGLENGTLYYFRLRGIGDGVTYDNSAYATDNESTAANAAPYFDSISGTAPSGTAQEGQTLTAPSVTYHDADGDLAGTHLYQWEVSDNGTSGWSDISSATASTFVIQAAQVGKYLRVGITPVALTGTTPGTEIFSAASAQVTSTWTSSTKSISLTTLNNSVTVPSSSDFDLSDGVTESTFVVSCWIKVLASGNHTIIQRSNNDNANLSFYVRIDSANQIYIALGDNSGTIKYIIGRAGGLTLNTWAHVVAAYKGTSLVSGMAIWQNGGTTGAITSVLAQAYTVNKVNSYPISVGKYFDGSTSANCLIDNLAIYTGVPSASIINSLATELYNTGVPVNHKNTSINTYLKAWWDFDDNLNDLKGNHNGSATTPVYSTDIKT